jgi:hypothetical protein
MIPAITASTWAGHPCHDVGLVTNSLFTHITSPGGATLLLPGPRGPGARGRKTSSYPRRWLAPPSFRYRTSGPKERRPSWNQPVGCVSQSHGSLDEVTSLDVGSSNISMNPSLRSRTHQNQTRKGEQSPLSHPLPHRCQTGERGRREGEVKSICNPFCIPGKPAPEDGITSADAASSC